MMTKTTLSDGRRTRPRFAAPTPTPPKFLIGTIEQSENHSTPSKQTTNPNPNGHTTALSGISRPLSGLVPLAQTHPRDFASPWRIAVLLISRPSSGLAPLALAHPRNQQSARTRSAARSKTPAGGRRYKNPPLATEFLIANLELEFELTHTKLSPPKILIANTSRFSISIFVALPFPASYGLLWAIALVFCVMALCLPCA
jgi:hypothetical protein